jgi:hypothetical protein
MKMMSSMVWSTFALLSIEPVTSPACGSLTS